MSYKLYTDKQEIFECEVKLHGTSFSKSEARIIIESDENNFVFKGKINENGKVTIPIKKMKGLLDEGVTGKINLEIIAENDFYFKPWNTDFIVETSRKAIVKEIKENQEINNDKPKIEISFNPTQKHPLFELYCEFLKENGMNKNKVKGNEKLLTQLTSKFLKENKISKTSMSTFITDFIVE